MSARNIAYAGAALLLFGLFTPAVTWPSIGTISLIGNGRNVAALVVLGLAVLSVVLTARNRLADLVWPGAAAGGILIYAFGRLQYGISQMRSALAELQDSPLAGLQSAMAVQIQWGWLLLGAGAALLIYVGVTNRSGENASLLTFSDKTARGLAALSLIGLAVVPALDVFATLTAPKAATSTASASSSEASATVEPTPASGPSKEEAAYIGQHLQLYELEAKYYDSVLDGRLPGVDFKIKNNGDRTLHQVEVRVVFYDANDKPIAEEEYHPVIVSSYSIGDNAPLRPNYIWQQEKGQFYSAKSVPSEWKTGKVTATITDIEFAPPE